MHNYPNFIPVNLSLRSQIHNVVMESKSSISAQTFANIYLFREKYGYKICRHENALLITGAENGESFFSVIGNIPPQNVMHELLEKYDYWKNITENQLYKTVSIAEDRDNFEYLYLRSDLVDLPGKSFQKKRNLINIFAKNYKQEECEQKELNASTVRDALRILDEWKFLKGLNGDYHSAKEALELNSELELCGLVFYVCGVPVAYCQGELLADNRSFAVHFEKAIDSYKGIYQYINQEFAKSLPENVVYINREQDLGDKGLRQAKMTYRPADFVKLFSSRASTKAG